MSLSIVKYSVTEKEKQILQMIADGKSTADVMVKLDLKRGYVNQSLSSCFERNNFENKTHAVAELIRKGVID